MDIYDHNLAMSAMETGPLENSVALRAERQYLGDIVDLRR